MNRKFFVIYNLIMWKSIISIKIERYKLLFLKKDIYSIYKIEEVTKIKFIIRYKNAKILKVKLEFLFISRLKAIKNFIRFCLLLIYYIFSYSSYSLNIKHLVFRPDF